MEMAERSPQSRHTSLLQQALRRMWLTSTLRSLPSAARKTSILLQIKSTALLAQLGSPQMERLDKHPQMLV